jgi:hypothetical protein
MFLSQHDRTVDDRAVRWKKLEEEGSVHRNFPGNDLGLALSVVR